MPERGPRKTLRWGFLVLLFLILLVAVAAVVSIRWMDRDEVPAKLALPDGVAISVAGVDFGTNHVLGSRLARWAARTPPMVQGGLKKIFGARAVPSQTFQTSTPMLVVWLNLPKPPAQKPHSPPQGSYLAYLADTGGFTSGSSQGFSLGFGLPMPMQFDAFPRRERSIVMHVFYRDNHDLQGKWSDCGTLSIANPEYRSYPQWQPETLPATNRAGDVEATLEQFKTGQGAGTTSTELANGGHEVTFPMKPWSVDNETACCLKVRSLSNPMRAWQVIHAEVSDATGNTLPNQGMTSGSIDSSLFTFSPGLWTNEAAWKLRCEIRCVKGFAPGELITFSNVPLPEMFQTNHLEWSTSLDGATVTLDYIIRRQPFTNGGWNSKLVSTARFVLSGATQDIHLEFVEAHADKDIYVQCRSGRNGENWLERDLSIPAEARTLNLTLGMDKSRWVEFLVKPETGPARFEFPPPRIWSGRLNH